MKNSNHNDDYGRFDPDIIDQNTTIDGTYSVEDQYKQELKHNEKEFGESDPDYYEQNTLVDNDNYARDEDPYQYQEEFVEDPKHPQGDFEPTSNIKAENIPNQERIVNEDDAITNDGEEKEWDDNDNDSAEVDYENDLEKDGDLDNNNEPEDMDDFEAEHYPENHPRE